MEWQEVGIFTLTDRWQYSEPVTGQDFKVVYLSSPIEGRNSTATISLASLDSLNDESLEFFRPQRINSYLSSEIVRFPAPPKRWQYRLAVKKLVLSKQQIPNFTIQIFMPPVADLTPDQPQVNPTIATTKIPTSVSIAGTSTAPIKLLPENTSKQRKHATFYNPSTKRNLYIDTDATISTASAIAKVAPGKVYISDIPGWQGEYWGMLDLSDTVATAIAIEEYL